MEIIEIQKLLDKLNELEFTTNPIKGKISKDNYERLGRIIGLFQRLETNIKTNIEILVGGKSDYLRPILEELSFKALLKSLRTLLIQEYEVLQNHHEVLIGQAFKAEEIRNRIVHSSWMGGEQNETAVSHKANNSKSGLKHNFSKISTEDFDLIIEWLDSLDTGMNDLYWRVIEERRLT